jgi:dTDP-4-amino-4,6-dideoxygalactose transaminase
MAMTTSPIELGGVAAAGERPASDRIPLQRPQLPSLAAVERYFARSRAAHWFSNNGPCARLLSERLEAATGSHCTPVASGTAGLMVAVAALLDGAPAAEGAIALMPSFTFPATAQAASWAGLTPRLLDVDPRHWHLDPAQLEAELAADDGSIALVIAVSAFGTPPPPAVRSRWEAACRNAGVPLLVDSAAGFGAVALDSVPVGRQGDVEVVSFHATKPFAAGEGGAVFTRDAALYERIGRLANFGLGLDRRPQYTLGLNAKLSELHAATALAALDVHADVLARRRAAAATMRARLASVGWQTASERSTWQLVPVLLSDAHERAAIAAACDAAGVETRVYYEPLHASDAYRMAPRGMAGLTATESLASRLLCLPMANDLTDAEIETITSAVARPLEAIPTSRLRAA